MHSAFDEKNSSKGRKFHFKYFSVVLFFSHSSFSMLFLCVHKDNTRNVRTMGINATMSLAKTEMKPKAKANERMNWEMKRMSDFKRDGGKERERERNGMKWPNMYDKQWKIHNEFEKDECKWSEVDFYQEFSLCIQQRVHGSVMHSYIYPHTWA